MKKSLLVILLLISLPAFAEPISGSALPAGLKFYDPSTDPNIQAAGNPNAQHSRTNNVNSNSYGINSNNVNSQNSYRNVNSNSYGTNSNSTNSQNNYSNMSLTQKKDYIDDQIKEFIENLMQSRDKYRAMSREQQSDWLNDQQQLMQKLANENNKLKKELLIEQEDSETEDNGF